MEASGLDDGCVDWVCMGDAFHWVEPTPALPEFARILRPDGALTVIWVVRDHARDPVQHEVDLLMRRAVPRLRRVYEDVQDVMIRLPDTLCAGGLFHSPLRIDGWHREEMSAERYLALCEVSQDVREQVSAAGWEGILDEIHNIIGGRTTVTVVLASPCETPC